MAILVTGGAGYIGSHTVAALLEQGKEVVVIDNLQTGHRGALLGGKLYEGDLRDKELLKRLFSENDIEAVIHFAANSLVGESMKDPVKYFDNNVYGTLCLLDAMNQANVRKIVFSSTAATYGEPEKVPIEESDKTEPTNVYGETKLTMERMMAWFDQVLGIKYVSLRYFNAAGAHESGKIGEDHRPESHLIPLIIQAVLGQRPSIKCSATITIRRTAPASATTSMSAIWRTPICGRSTTCSAAGTATCLTSATGRDFRSKK